MIVAIQDANILIDLHKSGLLEFYSRLGIETHTTDLVHAEIRQSVADYVSSGQLSVKEFSGMELAALLAFKAEQPRSLSLQDCSVLQLAIERSAVLLTGDGALRTRATSMGVDARGILWLMDSMVQETILDFPKASLFLRKLMATNRRLPAIECDSRLKIWAAGRGIPPRPIKR